MQNVNGFADNIAGVLLKIFIAGYGEFHIIGFSLGAQLSGAIGRFVISRSRGKYVIPRITGLDPGQIPLIIQRTTLKELNQGDARFVDTVHGESNQFGSGTSLGNASFWVNGGISQPVCRSVVTVCE